MALAIRPMEDLDVRGKRVLLRLDINSPIDPATKRIVNENRIDKSLPTLSWLIENGAKTAIIAHQGDTLDYQNLIPMGEHAAILTKKLGTECAYIDDVCGPAAREAVLALEEGQMVLLGNLRYLAEEVSTFEDNVTLAPGQMLNTYLVRSLLPLFDFYVNDAFSAAHRNSPSMVAFQQALPSAAGPLFFREITALERIKNNPRRPAAFILGGAKISDAFGMMKEALTSGKADRILTCGVTGNVFLIASGYDLGSETNLFIDRKGLRPFVSQAAELLSAFGDRIMMPVDLAYEENGARKETDRLGELGGYRYMDIGSLTAQAYKKVIESSGTIFVNGPAGAYENPLFDKGTREIWEALSEASGYTVIGGGDTVTAASRFCDLAKIDYVCTAGGAMVRFLSGRKLPLVEAMLGAK